MVDLMKRTLRAAITNEAPGGAPFRLPAGILGPKVLLINEMPGSGGDFFPWVFRQQKIGPLIGTRTWGGLAKSSVPYAMADGGTITAPDDAVFDPINRKWVAEKRVFRLILRSARMPFRCRREFLLERSVKEALKMLDQQGEIKIVPPPFPKPAKP